MQTQFNSIYDCIQEHNKCPLCQTILSYKLINYSHQSYIPFINADLTYNRFSFKLKYTTPQLHIDTFCNITTESKVYFYTDLALGSAWPVLLRALEMIGLRLEGHCHNEKCKQNYYVCSSTFRYEETKSSIKPFSLYMESFNLDHFCIHNNFATNQAYIYSDQTKTDPIKTSLLNLNKQEETFNKIRTLAVFS